MTVNECLCLTRKSIGKILAFHDTCLVSQEGRVEITGRPSEETKKSVKPAGDRMQIRRVSQMPLTNRIADVPCGLEKFWKQNFVSGQPEQRVGCVVFRIILEAEPLLIAAREQSSP